MGITIGGEGQAGGSEGGSEGVQGGGSEGVQGGGSEGVQGGGHEQLLVKDKGSCQEDLGELCLG